jgi:nitrate reductase NapD
MRVSRFDTRTAPAAPTLIPETPSGQVNICGVLVYSTPAKCAAVMERLNATTGCEVHTSSPDGRIVVVIEDTVEASALDRLRDFNDWDGVAASALVFHQFEDATALEGEIEAC